jgi:protoheme IX farnesyltransferase
MDRTKHRPVATGEFSKPFAISLSCVLMLIGLICLYMIKPLTALIGLSIILMYNGFYTMVWKKKWAFGAVPGAIPGALPITMGFSAVNDNIFSSVSVYLFILMFLWQMPHFWSLAIKYADDYAKGSFPVLPAVIGSGRTKYHISFYIWGYLLLAIMSPLFVDASYGYFLMVLPMALVMFWRFFVFFKAKGTDGWLSFFLITNLSMLVFVIAPLIDKWRPILFLVN